MSPPLASDMVRKGLAAFVERVEREPRLSPEEVRELLFSCTIPIALLEKLWELAQRLLDLGMEGRQLTFFLKEIVDVFDLGHKAFESAVERVKTVDLTSEERANGVSMLEQADRRCLQMRDELSALLRRLQAPPRPVDPASLSGARGDRKAEGYINLDDLVTRLLPRDSV